MVGKGKYYYEATVTDEGNNFMQISSLFISNVSLSKINYKIEALKLFNFWIFMSFLRLLKKKFNLKPFLWYFLLKKF